MNVVILGADGQLGRALRSAFPSAVALGRGQLDITDGEAVRGYDWTGVDTVLNAAAWTRVDAAEEPANLAAVRAVNVEAVGHLAAAAQEHGCTLVHISSEYVFDGTAPGAATEDLPPSPLSVYGASKADGDRRVAAVARHYIVRTSWVAGEGANFVRTMALLADQGKCPSVVDDQIGRPTFTPDLAAGIRHLLSEGAPFGTYNLTCAGDPASWADVAAATFEARGRSGGDIRRVSTAEYFANAPHAAQRPRNSVLDLAKIVATGFRPRDWRPALSAYCAALDLPEQV